jgi:hypothetical protein
MVLEVMEWAWRMVFVVLAGAGAVALWRARRKG